MRPGRCHGGPDALGAARWDFSTCANGLGPCPDALQAVRAADPTRYPDPAGTAVRAALARWHGVEAWRIVLAASASEFIQRITAVAGRLWPGAVEVPPHAYGDYAAAAIAWQRPLVRRGSPHGLVPTLRWHADPSSPLGQDGAPGPGDGVPCSVLDAVYAPLRLSGTGWSAAQQARVFVLHSPNKALGLTGIRGAYAIAPQDGTAPVLALCRALEAAAPSWPLSAQAEAMLLAWTRAEVQAWLAASRATLAQWKAELLAALGARGFQAEPSHTPFFVVRPPAALAPHGVGALRRLDLAVRDTASFGLPGRWRLSVQPAPARQALLQAIDLLAQAPVH